MQPIKGLLFDKDGTLFDFRATWSAWAADCLLALSGSEVKATQIGRAIGFNYETRTFAPDSIVIAGTPSEIAKNIAPLIPAKTEIEILKQMNALAQTAPQIEATPLGPLLTRLKRTYVLGVATNDAEETARANLASAGVEQEFDFIAGYDSGFGAKPEPGMQIGFCKATGLAPQSVAMIGDALHDLVSGRKAGMRTIGVLTGTATATDLAPYADAVLGSIADLPHWLEHNTK